MQVKIINHLIVKYKSFISYVFLVFLILFYLHLSKINTMTKKAKNIHLSEGAIKHLSIKAIEKGTNFKNYVEGILESLAIPKKKAK